MTAAMEGPEQFPAPVRDAAAELQPTARTSTPLDQVEFASAPQLEPAVLVINFDPSIPSEENKPLRQVLDWNDSHRLAEDYIADLADCSGGYVRCQIVEWLDVDAWPAKTDGFRYDGAGYMAAWLSRSGWHEPDALDYEALIAEYDLVRRINSNQIDEVWLFGFPLIGSYESIMVGPGATWCNAPPLHHPGFKRRFVIMGFNYERGVGPMLESFGHRVESMVQQAFDEASGTEPSRWQRFSQHDAIAPGEAGCGTMHFAPNSLNDYDWGNQEVVWSTCDDWLDYPNLTGVRREVNCTEWGDGDQHAHHLWWLRHLPRASGGSEGFLHNWWIYAVVSPDPNDERLARVPWVAGPALDIEHIQTLLEENAPSGGLRRLLRGGREREKSNIRRVAATALGDVEETQATRTLISLLADPATEVRLAAVEALGRRGDPQAIEPLTELLLAGNDDPEVLEAASAAVEAVDSSLDTGQILTEKGGGAYDTVDTEEWSRPAPPLGPGDILTDRFKIENLVEQGGLSTTYRAHDIRMAREVIIKVAGQGLDRPRFPEAMADECQAFARLDHPNLVQILDFATDPQSTFLVQAPVGEGRSLHDLLAEDGRLVPDEALPILTQLGQALDYVHRGGIIHQHIKPGHILLEGAGESQRAVLLDACMTRALQASDDAGVVGTPGYMSPELAEGKSVSPATDVYGLGLVAYELLTGRPPFTGDAFSLTMAHASESPRPPQEFVPVLGDATGAVILKALAKSPEERYPTAGEFVTALTEAAATTAWQEVDEAEESLQTEIEEILARLKPLHAKVRQKVQQLASLETELDEAGQEYEAATLSLREQQDHLRNESAELQARIGFRQPGVEEKAAARPPPPEPIKAEPSRPPGPQPDPGEKSVLRQHLYRVVDPSSDEGQDLLARLNVQMSDPNASLGSMLAGIPWGPVWLERVPDETSSERLERLTNWEGGLRYQREYLEASLERGQRDPRFEMVKVRAQGPEAWQAFLDDAAAHMRQDIETLEQELVALREAAGEREDAAKPALVRTVRIGLHGRNDVDYARHDYKVVRQAGIEALTMLSTTNPSVYERLGEQHPDLHFIVRLYDDRFGRGTRPSPREFVDRQVAVMRRLQPHATRFVIHNEPNHHEGVEGWGSSNAEAQGFQDWYQQTLELMRQACPWASFGFPALAPGDIHHDLDWLEVCRHAIAASDWLACHCYWQGENQGHPDWGQRFRQYHERFPDKRLVITEFGDSTPSLPAETLAGRCVQYYQALYEFDYLDAACAFLSSSPDPMWTTYTWAGEAGDLRPVVDAVGAMARPPLVSIDEPHNPAFWFVTANPEQYDWDRAFDMGGEDWTQVRGGEAQQNLSMAQPGDIVLAYRSTPDQYITGLGHIAAEPYAYQDRHAVRIEMDLKFETGIKLGELRQATPDLQHTTRTRPLSFSPVTDGQWAVVRELVLYHNPDLDTEGLPPTTVPHQHGIEMAAVEMPAEGSAGEQIQVSLRLRNRGNLIWRQGSQLVVECTWHPDPLSSTIPTGGPVPDVDTEGVPDPAWQWLIELKEDVPPGGELPLEDRVGEVPQQPGRYEARLQVRGPQWQPPVERATESITMIVRPAWLPRLSPDANEALAWAQGFAGAAGAVEISLAYLLAGLFEQTETTRRLLTLFDDEATMRDHLALIANDATGTDLTLESITPLDPIAPDQLRLSASAERAVEHAATLADDQGVDRINATHLLAGLLARAEGVAGPWLAGWLDVNRESLHRLLAGATEGQLPVHKIFYASNRRPELLEGHLQAINSLAFGFEGLWLLSGSDDATVRDWNLLRATHTSTEHTQPVHSVTMSADGDRLHVILKDGTYIRTNLIDGDIETLKSDDAEPISLTYSPDRQWRASWRQRGDVTVRDMTSGEDLQLDIPGQLSAVAIAPSGRYLSSALYGQGVSVANLPDGQERLRLTGHEGTISALAFTHDGVHLISAAQDRTLRVWDVASGSELHTLRGHREAVTAVVTIPDRPWAISGSADSTLRVWDLEAGRALATLPAHKDGVTTLALSPDARLLASGGAEGEIRLWDLEAVAAGLPQPISREQALPRIKLAVADLLDLEVDAIVHPSSPNLGFDGTIGQQIRDRLGDSLDDLLPSPRRVSFGGALVTEAPSLPARYLIHTPVRETPFVTVETASVGVAAALTSAEGTEDVRTIALPSVGTLTAGLTSEQTAPQILATILAHLERGSRLEQVTIAFSKADDLLAYAAAYSSLGGTIEAPAWLSRLSPAAQRAMALAEALRRHMGHDLLHNEHLLWALYQQDGGTARELLSPIASPEQVAAGLQELIGASDPIPELGPVSAGALELLPLAPEGQQALEEAWTLPLEDPYSIGERQVLAGLLDVPESPAARWLVENVGLPAGELYHLVTMYGEEEPVVPLAAALAEALRQARSIPVAGRPCFVRLEASSTDLAEATPFELTLHVTDDEVPGSQPLLVPESTLELVVYVNTSGFQPEGELPLTLPVPTHSLDGSLSLTLTPTREGEQELQVLVHPGRAEGAQPVRLVLPVWVARAARLPEIPEIIDRRAIPDPRPDVILHVALAPGGDALQLYGTLPALGRLRPTEMPALALSREDVTALRETAIQAAVESGNAPPPDTLAGLRALGAALFDRLMPEGHPLRDLYWHHLYALSETSEQMPAWLIVSDEEALLPWEMVCPYVPGGDGNIWYDHFLSERFALAHWVSRKGLRMAGEAPLGNLGLIHYGQRPGDELRRWQASLGGPTVVDVEDMPGHLVPAGPDSARYGLHILRYGDVGAEAGLITAAGTTLAEQPDEQGEALLQQRRLDFTLRRPVVGLSFVTEYADGNSTGLPLAARDNRLEASWLLPLLAARASALVGTRWPVRPEADQIFYQSFYAQMRAGAPLGWAAWYARREVRMAHPHRADWLAYTYYGHPWCQPYLVRPGRGYTIFEQIEHPEGAPLLTGEKYHFRASYRTEAPAWYTGRLRVQEAPLEGKDLSVVIMPLGGAQPTVYPLEAMPGSQDYEYTLELTMPDEATTLTIMVRFQRADQEIRTMLVELDVQQKERD